MKLLKPVYFVLMLVALVTFSSCLKSEDPPPSQGMDLVTVKKYMGTTWFENDYGKTYYISKDSKPFDFSKIRRAVIVYTFVNEEDIMNQPSNMTIRLINAADIEGKSVNTQRGSTADSLKLKEYDPIIAFDRMELKGDSFVVKNGFITAKVNYYFDKKIHGFSLYRYAEDLLKPSTNNPDTVDLYFGHNADGDKGGYMMAQYASTYPQLYFKSFDVNTLIPELATYGKDEVVMRINYQKVQRKDTVDAIQLVKFKTK